MASEPKRIWLSRDRDDVPYSWVHVWDCPPEARPDGTWHTAADEPTNSGVVGWVEAEYGVTVAPGQCVPIDLVPGEPLAEKE